MLEMMTHGWHDCLLRPRCGWANRDGYVEAVQPLIDQAAARNLVFSYCAHDHSSIRQDPEMTIIGRLLEYAQAKEMNIISYKQYHEQRTAERLISEPKTRVMEKELL
jgi:hypothetical protein